MIPAILVLIIYGISVYLGWKETLKLRTFLIQNGAISPDTAIFVDKTKYFVLTTKFPISAIEEEPDGAIWFNQNDWRPMIYTMGTIIVFSMFTIIYGILNLIF